MSLNFNDVMRIINAQEVDSQKSNEAEKAMVAYYKKYYDPKNLRFKFITKAGKELSISENLLFQENNFSLIIADEKDYAYTLIDFDGFQFDFPKELVNINNLNISNNRIQLTKSIYENWVEKKDKLYKSIQQRLSDSFGLMIDNKDLILNDSRYFLIRIYGFFYGYYGSICMGQWLEDINDFTFEVKTIEGVVTNAAIFSIAGSPLSGTHSWTGWSFDKKKIVHGNSCYDCKGTIDKRYYEKSGDYKFYLKSDNLHALLLLNEIGG